MDIKYYTNDNRCFNLNQGSIIIEYINLNNSELALFNNYVIQWTGVDDTNSTISSDGRIVNNLPNGVYGFRLVNPETLYSSSYNNITISSPPKLEITTVKHSEYSCNNNGSIYIEVSGGKKPYKYIANNYSIVTDHTSINITGLPPGQYNSISVSDANSCSSSSISPITIKNSQISSRINYAGPPQILDDYGTLDLTVIGYGPFDFMFTNIDTKNKIYVSYLETKYLILFDKKTNAYKYIFNKLLGPGTYEASITSINGCSTTIAEVNIPNINPMSVSIRIKEDDEQTFINYANSLPIFDTLLIPFYLIKNNSALWNLIKTKNLSDNIEFLINGELYNFAIIRNMGDKNYINNNEVEILRLSDNTEYWFFVLHLGPGININNNPDLIDSKIQIKGNENNFDVTLGLNNQGQIDNINASLIIGSLILDGLGYNQFYNGANLGISTTEPVAFDQYNFLIRNTKKNISSNTYNVGFVTIINFLQEFGVLNKLIQINSTDSSMTQNEYLYITSIKQLLQTLNNPNNFNTIFIFNPNSKTHNGAIYIDINSNSTIVDENRTQQLNTNFINYYYLDSVEDNLIDVYFGSRLLQNVSSVDNLKNGLYIIRIKDKYNNIPKLIYYNNKLINYDNHCIEAKQIIQNFNSNLLSKFIYGDILVYIGVSNKNLIDDILIPSTEIINTDNLPTTTIPLTPIVKQLYNDENTGTINISFMNLNIKCYLNGPQNYKIEFDKPTIFDNLIPGVYTIVADEKELIDKSLYQNEMRVMVEKDNTYDVILDFVSYENQIILKDINNNVY